MKKLGIALSAAAMVVVPIAAAAPASAALPRCTTTTDVFFTGGRSYFWAHGVPSTSSQGECAMGSSTSYNPAAASLQEALRNCNGFTSLTVDGKYGSNTTAAVREIQRRTGLSQDGVYGPNTQMKIKWHVTERDQATGREANYCGYITP